MYISQLAFFAVGGEIADMISASGPVAKLILLVLLFASLFSWAVIVSKWSGFRRARVQSGRFLRAFRKAPRFQDMAAVAEQFKPSPLVNVFEGVVDELRKQGAVGVRNVPSVQRAAQIASSEELTRLERRLPWLATTGNVTPFVGLFGTVWGIMNSFAAIAGMQNTNLAVVAPGIAEALFATAIGLVAAIPAVLAYNKISTDLSRFAGRLEGFAAEFGAILSRQTEQRASAGGAAVAAAPAE
jgi:biopolymer transport protein TolQ